MQPSCVILFWCGFAVVRSQTDIRSNWPQPVASCPDGFELLNDESDICVRVLQRSDPIIQCPPGSSRQNRKCLVKSVIPDELTCLPGYELNEHDMCERKAPQQTYSCETGYTLQDNRQCIWSGSRVQCPPKFELSSKGDHCERVVQMPPVKICPENASRDSSGQCQVTATEPTRLSCEAGYKRVGDGCVGVERADSILDCPVIDGQKTNRDGSECILLKDVTTKAKRCPDGMVWKGSVCEEVETTRARLSCKRGFRFDEQEGFCIRESVSKPDIVCNRGYKLGG